MDLELGFNNSNIVKKGLLTLNIFFPHLQKKMNVLKKLVKGKL